MMARFDVAIIGAGPTGLCLAKSLAELGLTIAVIERQAENTLATPVFDGREIALTHHSAKLLRELGVWDRIESQAISTLRDARVFNGASLFSLNITHQETAQSELGFLIANHHIRKAAYEAAKSTDAITLKANVQVTNTVTDAEFAEITLNSDEVIRARLLIGADSRFSETRRAMGIAADLHDFGKTMMVCVMEHPVSHEQTAWEWFDYGQTLALLPMNGLRSSVVITLSPDEMNHLMNMPEEDFNREVSSRFKHRLGAMRLVSTRHTYPLVTAFAKRLIGQRFALVGDAAVGMHPVTAHGFNFGLKGIATLSAEIKLAIAAGEDIASEKRLLHYEQLHRRDTRPLFLATHAIAKIYSSNSAPARFLRSSALRIGNRITPFKRAAAGFLADAR